MKNTVIDNLKYATSIVALKVGANTCDPKRIGNAGINKAEVMRAIQPTADSKEDSASGKDDIIK